jgi:hypothetical protein
MAFAQGNGSVSKFPDIDEIQTDVGFLGCFSVAAEY